MPLPVFPPTTPAMPAAEQDAAEHQQAQGLPESKRFPARHIRQNGVPEEHNYQCRQQYKGSKEQGKRQTFSDHFGGMAAIFWSEHGSINFEKIPDIHIPVACAGVVPHSACAK